MEVHDDVMEITADKPLDHRKLPPAVRHKVRMIHKRNLRATLESSLPPLYIHQTTRRDDPANMARRVAADERRQRQASKRRRNYARCIKGNWSKLAQPVNRATVLVGRRVEVDLAFVKQYA